MSEAIEAQFQIHKLYIKDLSFEIPKGTQVFQADWTPELNLEVQTQSKALAEKDTHEVTLKVTATVTNQKETAFIAEVEQAGIFTISQLDQEQLHHTLGAYCPSILYPYLREAVSDVVMKGGFPQLALAPVNFDALYQQQLEKETASNTDNVVAMNATEQE